MSSRAYSHFAVQRHIAVDLQPAIIPGKHIHWVFRVGQLASGRRGDERRAQPVSGRTAGNKQPPRLDVAVRRRTLSQLQDLGQHLLRHRSVGDEAAHAPSLANHIVEIVVHWRARTHHILVSDGLRPGKL